jgi:hypothetical protein
VLIQPSLNRSRKQVTRSIQAVSKDQNLLVRYHTHIPTRPLTHTRIIPISCNLTSQLPPSNSTPLPRHHCTSEAHPSIPTYPRKPLHPMSFLSVQTRHTHAFTHKPIPVPPSSIILKYHATCHPHLYTPLLSLGIFDRSGRRNTHDSSIDAKQKNKAHKNGRCDSHVPNSKSCAPPKQV